MIPGKAGIDMRTYTFTECCTLLRVNPKTLHKWLEREGMHTQQSRADTRIRYLTHEQVEYLAEVYSQMLHPPEEQEVAEDVPLARYKLLMERLDLLESELRHAQDAIATLQQQILEHTETPAAPSSKPDKQRAESDTASVKDIQPPPKAKKKTRTSKARGKRLPASLVLLRTFAEQHHVSLKVAERAGKAGKIAVVRGKWLVNSRYVTEALGTRGQYDFYTVFHERQDFTQCERCPHEIAP
jgi:DNA-binding transcriptional MerR regulator